MPTVLKETHPTARKRHFCGLCGCAIEKGQKYTRQTCADGDIYDFVAHEECCGVAVELDMYNECCAYEGLTSEIFCEFIEDYIQDSGHEDWGELSMYEKVCRINEETDKRKEEKE